MGIYSKNQKVEFTTGIACKVIAVGGVAASEDMKGRIVRIPAGTEAYANEEDYEGHVLPGDIPVIVMAVKELNGANAAVGAKAGCIVPFEIEEDPDTGKPAFKVYRNMKVALPRSVEDEDA